MTVKELIVALLDGADMNDEVVIHSFEYMEDFDVQDITFTNEAVILKRGCMEHVG